MNPAEGFSILAFGAHPDDIEFGCGGIIARETQAGRAAHFVVCTLGESATRGTPEERGAEAARSAAFLGATLEFANLGGDAHLEASLANRLVLAEIIRRHRPRIVLAPTAVENQHPDHARVGLMVRDAARLARYGGVAELKALRSHAIDQLLCYAITAEGEPTDRSAILFDVSDPMVMAAWTAAMGAHESQSLTRNYRELQLARARVRGLQAGVGHAMAIFPNDSLVFSSLDSLGRAARDF